MFKFHVNPHMVDDDAFMELEAIFLGHFLFFWNDKFITFYGESSRCTPSLGT